MAESNRTKEIWRPWDGPDALFRGLYEVSSLGCVRSIPRTFTRHEWRHGRDQIVRVGGNVLRGHVRRSASGRPVVVLVSLKDIYGHSHTVRVHRMVLEAFVGHRSQTVEGCHNNGDPTDNRVENLRWDTRAGNRADMVDHGTVTAPPVHRGERHPMAKLNPAAVREIRESPRTRGTAAQLARKFGISGTHVRRIRNGEGWDSEP